ncbi:PadR family transcriptional regulator [Microcella daejeonensis]|uniref:PadR family transcriptional regulator n=1 Tax=Microcella daejeonensis TaxID=2994971 RepID=UPI0039841427
MSPAVFGHGHLRLYLLHVLAERPMHGYEIIQALSDRFGGTYTPSAGTIYPRLSKLEEEGLVTKQSDGRKTVYSITDAGRQELADRQDELEGIEDGIGDSVRRLADEVRSSVGAAMKELRAELAAATREARDEARASGRDARDSARSAAGAARDAQSGSGAAPSTGGAWAMGPGSSTGTSADGEPAGAGASESASAASAPRAPRVERDLAFERAQRADAALTRFRHELRAELRTAAARSALPEAAAEHLEQGLDRLRAEVRGLLG